MYPYPSQTHFFFDMYVSRVLANELKGSSQDVEGCAMLMCGLKWFGRG